MWPGRKIVFGPASSNIETYRVYRSCYVLLCIVLPAVNNRDNCPHVSNQDQTDEDVNGVGDACEGCKFMLGVHE